MRNSNSSFLPRTTHHALRTLVVVFLFSSCSSVPTGQPQVGYHLSLGQYDQAVNVFRSNPSLYGAKNSLLYDLDYALTLHYAGRYQESVQIFEKAKAEYEKRQTTSVTRTAATWIVNDTMSAYHGEDFERVMVNVFQAVNFAVMGNWAEALVEARNADRVLNLINDSYPDDKKNVYREDAFVRLLMGIMYEASGSRQDLNDALIEYRRAYEIYQGDYKQNYDLGAPRILLENYAAVAEALKDDAAERIRQLAPSYVSLAQRQNQTEVYLIWYHGTSPTKYQATWPIPIDGILTPVAFPAYQEQFYPAASGSLRAVSPEQTVESSTEKVEDIGKIAILNLDNRRVRTIAKSLIRSGIRTAIEHNQIENIESHHDRAAQWVQLGASVYNLVAEQADLRSWQLLPGEIRLSRLILPPGEHEIFFRDQSLGKVQLKAGEKKFFVARTIFQ